ncbi:MAG: ATP-binding protein [Lachnospiraceae bacterium]|nr:ATP-binding protein [Lachnospiraceae bacterium]
MANTVSIGNQDFESIREKNCFYVDKTNFIKEWWEGEDTVTLIARPRRFGKTLTISMLEQFFSNRYASRKDLFEGLSIWEHPEYRKLQGTYPVISLSFARVKEQNYTTTREKICEIITNLYIKYFFLRDSEVLTEKDKEYFDRISTDMRDSDATSALYQLSDYLCRYYGKKVIILLDEYDTPMQEAYVYGYWEELAAFTRSLFNATFKSNPYLERAIMTGITKVSKESVFSDLNNLEVVTTTSEKYADCFGFTEKEVFDTLEQFDLSDKKEDVKYWYDGFTFGNISDIYNPWSIINYLDKKQFKPYWANTSSNNLVGKLIKEGSPDIKKSMEDLIEGKSLKTEIDEQIVFNQLGQKESAIWSLLLASGYLKVKNYALDNTRTGFFYEMVLTNHEVLFMFRNMIKDWFSDYTSDYNEFIKMMFAGDLEAMNYYMNEISFNVFSYFDTGERPSKRSRPERFYHGFVLGLLVDLRDRYVLTSNRESGFGRYDIMLEPMQKEDVAFIMEFKIFNPNREKELSDTVESALGQIEEKKYEQVLVGKGIAKEKIRKYGFAFRGKEVLIGECNN